MAASTVLSATGSASTGETSAGAAAAGRWAIITLEGSTASTQRSGGS